MKVRGSVVSLRFYFPHPPVDKKKLCIPSCTSTVYYVAKNGYKPRQTFRVVLCKTDRILADVDTTRKRARLLHALVPTTAYTAHHHRRLLNENFETGQLCEISGRHSPNLSSVTENLPLSLLIWCSSCPLSCAKPSGTCAYGLVPFPPSLEHDFPFGTMLYPSSGDIKHDLQQWPRRP